tara:strand:+ start:1236 stop:1538 length:303 start_codon:yes stop_codon:yes gene_type:complete
MWKSWLRSLIAAPPSHVESLRPLQGEVWLRCTHPKCAHCQDFEAEGKKAAFEADKAHVVDWDCSQPAQRQVAKQAGVADLPAYVKVPSRGRPIEVVTPAR